MKLWIRISLLGGMLAVLFSVALSVVYKFESEKLLLSEHDHWSSGLSQALSSAILKDTIQNKSRNVKEVLQRVIKDNPSISYLLVIGFDGEPLASTLDVIPEVLLSRHHINNSIQQLTINDEVVTDITRPLVKNLDAHLHIGVNHHFLDQSIDESEAKVITTTIAITLIAVFIGIILSRQISGPIEQLSSSLKAFGKGEKYSPIDMSRANIEVQNLYESFKDMAAQREDYENELKFYRQELEHLVKKRTIELENEVTHHKETTKGLMLAKNQAEEANNAKSTFLSQMSHEFRTPLNAILGFSQLIAMDNNHSPDTIENLQIIKSSGDHLLQLINEILDLAKIETGKLEVSVEPVSWHEIVQECILLIKPAADQCGVSVVYNMPENSNLLVNLDRTRIKQITLNLLNNAVKYNKKDGSIYVYFDITHNEMLKLLVTDTGKGIAKKNHENLFEPFNRFDNSNSSIEGTGIGLVITKRLTELMNGKIGFNSEEGKGSTFWVAFPLINEMVEKTDLETVRTTRPLEIQSRAGIKMLLIEDNPVNIKLVKKMVERFNNVHFVSCNLPEEGVKTAAEILPDIILLDINMPDMDGYEVKKQLDQIPGLENIPIIAFSANAMQKDLDAAKKAGFNDYLTKPVNIDTFVKTLNQHLDNKIG